MHFFFLTLECLDGISNQWCSAYFRFFWLQQAISKALCLNQKKKKKKERKRSKIGGGDDEGESFNISALGQREQELPWQRSA